MTVALIDALSDAFEALRKALDGDDVAAIDAAAVRVQRATADVRAVGAWRSDPALRERLSVLASLMESTRVRTSVLADQTRQRIDLLAAHGAKNVPLTYSR
jgi:hypothetical protein